jgi:hypothetical protein
MLYIVCFTLFSQQLIIERGIVIPILPVGKLRLGVATNKWQHLDLSLGLSDFRAQVLSYTQLPFPLLSVLNSQQTPHPKGGGYS